MPILGVEATSALTEPPTVQRPPPRPSNRAPASLAARAQTTEAQQPPLPAAAADAQKPPVVDFPDGTSLRFFVDPDTGKTVASLVDPRSGEVLRQVPSAEALELAKRLGKQSGLVLDLKV